MGVQLPVFWGEIAPCDHVVQIYEKDSTFLDALEGFIGGGLTAGDSTVVIATPVHLAALSDRLRARGIDVSAAIADEQYVALDAAATLERFMVDHWPDDEKFAEVVADVLDRAQAGGRSVRVFGEMVAVLWARGDNGATVRLEHLWKREVEARRVSLLCAYPRSGFTKDATSSMNEICAAHSRVVD
jgi:hypothetical protein